MASGLACVTLKTQALTQQCVDSLDGKPLLGRPMIVRAHKYEQDDLDYEKPAKQPETQAAQSELIAH